jgi:hypothetical protein
MEGQQEPIDICFLSILTFGFFWDSFRPLSGHVPLEAGLDFSHERIIMPLRSEGFGS